MFDNLLYESDRGAIIIGTQIVDEQLTMLIKEILPPDVTKQDAKRLVKYPGPLSSMSARIELCFAFRLIPLTLYTSLNTLREIRNEAAHSPKIFSMNSDTSKFKKIFDLGPGIPALINKMAKKLLVDQKFHILEYLFDKHNLSQEDRAEQALKILDNKDLLESIEKQVPHWELICGLSLLCGFIKYHQTKYASLLMNNSTWASLHA